MVDRKLDPVLVEGHDVGSSGKRVCCLGPQQLENRQGFNPSREEGSQDCAILEVKLDVSLAGPGRRCPFFCGDGSFLRGKRTGA